MKEICKNLRKMAIPQVVDDLVLYTNANDREVRHTDSAFKPLSVLYGCPLLAVFLSGNGFSIGCEVVGQPLVLCRAGKS